jgi:hypothetical protein
LGPWTVNSCLEMVVLAVVVENEAGRAPQAIYPLFLFSALL